MRASSVSAPTRSARITTVPVPLTVAPMTRSPGRLRDGHRLAGDHRFVDGRFAFLDDAVDRNAVARTDAQAIAGMNVVERDVLVAAVGAHAPRALGRQLQQRADRGAGAAAGAQLQHLPEQHQRHDRRGGLEVEGDAAVVAAKRGREDPGREHGDQAVARTRRRRRARSA